MDRSFAQRLALVLLITVTTVLLTGCGGGDDASDTTPTKQATPDTPAGGGSVPTVDHADHGGNTGAERADLKLTMEQVSAKSGAGVPLPTRMNCTKSTPATCSSTVTCPAEDADDEAPCAWMAKNGAHLPQIAKDSAGQVCTMIYGGPETVKITGTVDDAPVDVTFSRQNGCAIAAWDEAAPLWTEPST